MERFEQLKQSQTLEAELWHLEQQTQALRSQLPMEKYRLREAKIALVEYESSHLRVWLDKRKGNWEEKLEKLRRDIRDAESGMSKLQQELETASLRCAEKRSAWENLGIGDTLACAGALEPDQRRVIVQREAALCAVKLTHLLEENRIALEAAREWVRPNNRVQTAPGINAGNLLAQADQWAQKCCEQLYRMAECGILADIHGYFMNPAGYICGVTRYNQIDRVTTALLAIGDAQIQMKHLLKQFREDGIWEETV